MLMHRDRSLFSDYIFCAISIIAINIILNGLFLYFEERYRFIVLEFYIITLQALKNALQ